MSFFHLRVFWSFLYVSCYKNILRQFSLEKKLHAHDENPRNLGEKLRTARSDRKRLEASSKSRYLPISLPFSLFSFSFTQELLAAVPLYFPLFRHSLIAETPREPQALPYPLFKCRSPLKTPYPFDGTPRRDPWPCRLPFLWLKPPEILSP